MVFKSLWVLVLSTRITSSLEEFKKVAMLKLLLCCVTGSLRSLVMRVTQKQSRMSTAAAWRLTSSMTSWWSLRARRAPGSSSRPRKPTPCSPWWRRGYAGMTTAKSSGEALFLKYNASLVCLTTKYWQKCHWGPSWLPDIIVLTISNLRLSFIVFSKLCVLVLELRYINISYESYPQVVFWTSTFLWLNICFFRYLLKVHSYFLLYYFEIACFYTQKYILASLWIMALSVFQLFVLFTGICSPSTSLIGMFSNIQRLYLPMVGGYPPYPPELVYNKGNCEHVMGELKQYTF